MSGALEPRENAVRWQRRTCHRDHGAVVPSSPQASTQDVPIHLTHLNVQQQDVELPAHCQGRLHLRPILMHERPRGKGTTVRGAQLTPPQGWTKVAYLGLQCKWRQGRPRHKHERTESIVGVQPSRSSILLATLRLMPSSSTYSTRRPASGDAIVPGRRACCGCGGSGGTTGSESWCADSCASTSTPGPATHAHALADAVPHRLSGDVQELRLLRRRLDENVDPPGDNVASAREWEPGDTGPPGQSVGPQSPSG